MKLNIGCGRTVYEGWYNIDAVISPRAKRPPELLCDIRKIPLPDGCATEAMAIHVWEHIDRWECDATIDEWARLLQAGGRLILEMPDLLKCCRNILNGTEGKTPDQLGMWGLFGDPTHKDPLMMHRWAWTFATIQPFLFHHGFVDITEHETEFHFTGRGVRDFRVTARKP